MWVDVVLASLFMMFVAAAVTLLTCGLGGLIVGPLMPFVSSHFWYQFYLQYLARGGRPVPMKVAPQPLTAPAGAMPTGYVPPKPM